MHWGQTLLLTRSAPVAAQGDAPLGHEWSPVLLQLLDAVRPPGGKGAAAAAARARARAQTAPTRAAPKFPFALSAAFCARLA